MRGTFAQLTVGGRGTFEFRVAAINYATLSATLEVLSASGTVLGTATVDLAANTAALDFTSPLAAADVEVLSQVFVEGDVIRRSDGVDFVAHGMSGTDVLTAVVDGVAINPQHSGDFYRVGTVS